MTRCPKGDACSDRMVTLRKHEKKKITSKNVKTKQEDSMTMLAC